MKTIQRAKFNQGGLHSVDGPNATRVGSVIQPAIVELDGLQWSSAVPKTAAEAAKINAVVAKWEGVTS